MSTLLKLGLSGYDVKLRFCAFQCEYLLQNPLFLGKNFGGTRHPCENNEPALDLSGGGGGVHGKACWIIAYIWYTLIIYSFNYKFFPFKKVVYHRIALHMFKNNLGCIPKKLETLFMTTSDIHKYNTKTRDKMRSAFGKHEFMYSNFRFGGVNI